MAYCSRTITPSQPVPLAVVDFDCEGCVPAMFTAGDLPGLYVVCPPKKIIIRAMQGSGFVYIHESGTLIAGGRLYSADGPEGRKKRRIFGLIEALFHLPFEYGLKPVTECRFTVVEARSAIAAFQRDSRLGLALAFRLSELIRLNFRHHPN